MHPDAQQNQSGVPVSAQHPAGPQASTQAVPFGVPAASISGEAPVLQGRQAQQLPTASSTAELRAAEQAKRLVSQYGNDPYRLSEALGRLKATFQADQFHIVPKQTDGR